MKHICRKTTEHETNIDGCRSFFVRRVYPDTFDRAINLSERVSDGSVLKLFEFLIRKQSRGLSSKHKTYV